MSDLEKLISLVESELDSKNKFDFNDMIFHGYKGAYIFIDTNDFFHYVDKVGVKHDGATLKTIIKFREKFYSIPWYYSSWDSNDIAFNQIVEVEKKEVVVSKWLEV